MPTKNKTPCKAHRCPNLTEPGEMYCDEHKKKRHEQYDRNRKSSSERGYNYKWQKYRKNYLMENPLCVKCLEEGKTTPATQVDHIEPVDGPHDQKFWDPENHQPLCASHHSWKTAKEDGGFGNAKG